MSQPGLTKKGSELVLLIRERGKLLSHGEWAYDMPQSVEGNYYDHIAELLNSSSGHSVSELVRRIRPLGMKVRGGGRGGKVKGLEISHSLLRAAQESANGAQAGGEQKKSTSRKGAAKKASAGQSPPPPNPDLDPARPVVDHHKLAAAIVGELDSLITRGRLNDQRMTGLEAERDELALQLSNSQDELAAKDRQIEESQRELVAKELELGAVKDGAKEAQEAIQELIRERDFVRAQAAEDLRVAQADRDKLQALLEEAEGQRDGFEAKLEASQRELEDARAAVLNSSGGLSAETKAQLDKMLAETGFVPE